MPINCIGFYCRNQFSSILIKTEMAKQFNDIEEKFAVFGIAGADWNNNQAPARFWHISIFNGQHLTNYQLGP